MRRSGRPRPPRSSSRRRCVRASQRDVRDIEAGGGIATEHRDLLVVVTDTPDEVAEGTLQGALARMEFLEGLALVAGYDGADPESDPPQQAG